MSAKVVFITIILLSTVVPKAALCAEDSVQSAIHFKNEEKDLLQIIKKITSHCNLNDKACLETALHRNFGPYPNPLNLPQDPGFAEYITPVDERFDYVAVYSITKFDEQPSKVEGILLHIQLPFEKLCLKREDFDHAVGISSVDVPTRFDHPWRAARFKYPDQMQNDKSVVKISIEEALPSHCLEIFEIKQDYTLTETQP